MCLGRRNLEADGSARPDGRAPTVLWYVVAAFISNEHIALAFSGLKPNAYAYRRVVNYPPLVDEPERLFPGTRSSDVY